MITFVRSAEADRSHVNEAVGWAVQVANWINGKFPDVTVNVMRNISGSVFGLHWVTNAESLGEFEQIMGQIDADPEYQNMLTEAREKGYFVQGSLQDNYYRSVP